MAGDDARYSTVSFLGRAGAIAEAGEAGSPPRSQTPEWLGDPQDIDRRNIWQEGDAAREYDTQEGKDNLVEQNYIEGGRQIDAARSPEQQLGNYAYYNWNLAQNNPRGNLNRRSYDTTLRMQRLADMVNNRLHYKPGTATTIGGAQGAKSVGQGGPTVESWQPIETEETRQMEANRRVDERARNAGVDLQSRIQAYPQEIQEDMDAKARELRYYIAQMDDDYISYLQKTYIETEYKGSWSTWFEQQMERFLTELDLDTKSEIYQVISDLLPGAASQFGYVFLNGNYIPQPMKEWYLEQIVNNLLANCPPEAAPILLDIFTKTFGVMMGQADATAFGNLTFGGKGQVQGTDYSETWRNNQSSFRKRHNIGE